PGAGRSAVEHVDGDERPPAARVRAHPPRPRRVAHQAARVERLRGHGATSPRGAAMAESGLIAAYLAELRGSLGSLSDVDDIVAEAEDHLLETTDRLVGGGTSLQEAEAEALKRYGSARIVSRVFVNEARRGA